MKPWAGGGPRAPPEQFQRGYGVQRVRTRTAHGNVEGICYGFCERDREMGTNNGMQTGKLRDFRMKPSSHTMLTQLKGEFERGVEVGDGTLSGAKSLQTDRIFLVKPCFDHKYM